MANQALFANKSSTVSKSSLRADTVNNAGGAAYSLSNKGALAQLTMTGVFNDTYYADAKSQLTQFKELSNSVDPVFLAKLAVYARQRGYMKDTSAFLLALLAAKNPELLAKVFSTVVDNGKMLRNFVQIIRSGEAGRKSLGTRPKKLVADWLNSASDAQLLAASVGNKPSLADVIKLAHPRAGDAQRDAFYKYLLGRDVEVTALPENVQELERYRKQGTGLLPDVPFALLTSLSLTKTNWITIARNATWQQTRMNLNTFLRHGVFDSKKMVNLIAHRLRDKALIEKSKVFPYQLMATYLNVNDELPYEIQEAIQDALELSLENVPKFDVDSLVFVDVSGSMGEPVTGDNDSATTKMTYIHVASLFAAAILRKNKNAKVTVFDTKVHSVKLNPRDSVMTNAETLSDFRGGGTDCGIALADANLKNAMAELVIYVSDNESWVTARPRYRNCTSVMDEWEKYKARVPNAKLVCIDISPNTTSQAKSRKDILNVGGFSDSVFDVIHKFANGQLNGKYWESEIDAIKI